MLFQIFSLLLNVAVGLVAGTCLLRMFMQLQRVSLAPLSGNPFGPFIFTFTNWCVLPLRKLLPTAGRLDLASLLAAYLVILAKFVLLSVLSMLPPQWEWIAFFALLEWVHLALSSLMWLVIAYVVLSWVRTDSDINYFMGRLVEPLLAPLRRILPQPGGLDLSPLALLLLIQIAEIVINAL
ncbi:MAG: hypothetical protein RLY90_866 [Pseudomonadota bacterium]|jgi:YggT family protein